MAEIGSNIQISTNLAQIMTTDPGMDANLSYQLCKLIYAYHPLGGRIIDAPVHMAMHKPREISVPDAPEEVATKAFTDEWDRMGCDAYIENAMRISRIYGISTLALESDDFPPSVPIPPEALSGCDIRIKVFDPLNTAGSLVLNQTPTAPDFMKPVFATIQGESFHPSRTVVMMNEDPLYLLWSTSAFGFVGRSVFQRAIYPLQSFISTMVCDNLVAKKAGVLVAKIKSPGSIINQVTVATSARKREVVKEAENESVISLGIEEEIESLNLQNIDGAMTQSRKHIISNIANATGIPEQLLTQEKFAKGLASGDEDTKAIADYVDGVRHDMRPLYEFFTTLVQRKAWTPAFYQSVQEMHPAEYGNVPYEEAFAKWRNSFEATWPVLVEERQQTMIEQEKMKLDVIIQMVEKMGTMLDPENKGRLLEWAESNINELGYLFPNKLELDYSTVVEGIIQQEQREMIQMTLGKQNGEQV